MTHDTMRRDGGWTVELVNAIDGGKVKDIDINPAELDHVDRWGKGEIRSTMGLLEELSGVPEAVLRKLVYPDVDRVMFALSSVLPPVIRHDMEKAARPLFTPPDPPMVGPGTVHAPVAPQPPAEEPEPAPASLFPDTAGPVKEFPPGWTPPQEPPAPPRPRPGAPAQADEGLDLKQPEVARKVG